MMQLSKNSEQNRNLLPGARVAVLGAARSGIAVSNLFATAGAFVLLSDVRSEEELSLLDFAGYPGVRLETGGHSAEILKSDLICISPGLPLTIPILQQAIGKGIPVVGEIEVASWFCRAPIIAVTGSNGKTTTTALAGEILKTQHPNSIVAGNIGKPFSESVTKLTAAYFAILEISSFQLETIHSFHPRIAAILNLTANHLDRYPDFEAYAKAKLNVLKNMTEQDVIIYNKDDSYLEQSLKDSVPKKVVFSQVPHSEEGAFWEKDSIIIQLKDKRYQLKLSSYQLRGPHNRYNMMTAALLGVLTNVSEKNIVDQIEKFEGIEHRLEVVRKLNGITFVNDSKATTVESLSYALKSFSENIVLIAGGKDKGGDFAHLKDLLQSRVKAAVLIGQAAGRMKEAWNGTVPIRGASELRLAVKTAYHLSEKGDVVLFSPACSSFDMFRDYEERGNTFKKIVGELEA